MIRWLEVAGYCAVMFIIMLIMLPVLEWAQRLPLRLYRRLFHGLPAAEVDRAYVIDVVERLKATPRFTVAAEHLGDYWKWMEANGDGDELLAALRQQPGPVVRPPRGFARKRSA